MSYFAAAYLVLWVGLFAYLVGLGARLRRLRDEARALAEEPDRDRRETSAIR
jgi:CcmD family protein